MIRARHASFLVLSIWLGAPRAASAIGADPAEATAVQREQAQALFVKGKRHYDAGDYTSALAEFQRSIDVVQSPNARLFVARCFRELHRLVEAYVEFERTTVEAKEHAAADGRYAKAAEAATAERTALEPHLGFVTMDVKNAAEDTKVYVADSEIKRGGWTEPVPVMPGPTEIRVETPNRESVRVTVMLQAGERRAQTIDANAQVAPVRTEAPPPPPPRVEGSSKGVLVPAALGAFGVGVAGFAVWGIAGAISLNTLSDLESKCGKNTPCPGSLQGEVSRGRTEQTISNVGLVVGIVGAVAGGALLTIALLPSSKPGPTARVSASPSALMLSGTFW